MKFRNIDAPTMPAQGRIDFEMVLARDMTADTPDEKDEGFWPSLEDFEGDTHAFSVATIAAQARMAAWEADDWYYVGVMAKATVHVPIGGCSFAVYELESPGLWGVESDSGEAYFAEVFADEKAALLDAIRAMGQLAQSWED